MTVRKYDAKVAPVPFLSGNILSAVGVLRATLNRLIMVPDFGTYTPTLTNVANLDSSTAYPCSYVRIGNIVLVGLYFEANPTTTLVLTQVRVSLPIASNFTSVIHCVGSGSARYDPNILLSIL